MIWKNNNLCRKVVNWLLLLAIWPAMAQAGTDYVLPGNVDISRHLVGPAQVGYWLTNGHRHLAIIEVSKPAEFAKGHLQGALNLWRSDYQAEGYPYSGMCPTAPVMEEMLGRLGITAEDTILLYDERGNVNAARLWWMLTRYGHPHTMIIDGGKQALEALKLPLDTVVTRPVPATFTFTGPGEEALFADKALVQAAMQDSNYILLDVRTLAEYAGTEIKKGASRGGHIPGSIHLNYTEALLYEDGVPTGMKWHPDMLRLYTDHGITPDKTIIVYCHSGMRSSLTTFVLKELLRYPEVKNYDGSWVEWSYFPDLPVATGAPDTAQADTLLAITEPVSDSTTSTSYWALIRQSYRDYWNYLVDEVSLGYDYKPKWQNFFYGLIVLSLFFYGLELLWPWRKNQARIRKDFWLDAFYMFFNLFLFGLILFFALENVLVEAFGSFLGWLGIENLLALKVHTLPVWAYFIILFVVADFIQWNVHRLLHRVPWLWEFHKLHHSVEEMGFAAHLRFHWMETLVYKGIQAIPLTMLGYNLADLFVLHIFNLAWGHFNHSNITVPGRVSGSVFGALVGLGLGMLYAEAGWVIPVTTAAGLILGGLALGPVMKYLFNSPEMHIWHHAHDLPEDRKYGANFGITLAIWDYLFGTAYLPHSGRDIRLGFSGIEKYPKGLFRQLLSGFRRGK